MDCGAACLKMVAQYYGREYSFAYLKKVCDLTKTGATLGGISRGADAIGLNNVGVLMTWEELSEKIKPPYIVHWNKVHFVVVYEVCGDKVVVGDPTAGIIQYSVPAFLKCWHSAANKQGEDVGAALLFEPTDEFFAKDIPDSKPVGFRYILRYLKPHTKQLTQLLVGILLGSVLSLAFPFLSQAIVDGGIANKDIHFITIVLLAQVALIVGIGINSLIRNWLMLHITTRISISLIEDFLGKLMRLPITYFDKHLTGDLLQRINDFTRIQNFLTGTLISIVVAVTSVLVYGTIMGGYSLLLLAIFGAGSVLYVGWVLVFLRRRRILDYMRFQESASSQSNVIQIINGMQEIKLNNCEDAKRREWQDIQVRLFNINIRGESLSQLQTIGGLLIDQGKNVVLSFLAAYAVVNGSMTLGMMLALQYIIGQLNAPVYQFVGFMQSIQEAKISLERLNEIMEIEDEEPANEVRHRNIPDGADIVLKNVMFHYVSPKHRKILDNINLTIEANKTTAIVGVSGSGKTTILKLILGFYKPTSGSVTLNGVNITNYSLREWRRKCGVVMQDGFLFTDSVSGNIGVSDENPDSQNVINASRLANFGSTVADFAMGYDTIIGGEGVGISAGQKQRVLIARAIYKNAPYLILDEASNALDANNERIITDNLSEFYRNKTVIVVAHRLSTVKNADKIVVLDNGKIVETGTHEELIKTGGHYFNLVKNQLELGL